MTALAPRLHAAAAAFWREWYRELRRHAGNERLPYAIRVDLRGAADRALGRAEGEERRAVVPHWNRRAMETAPPVRLSPADEERARQRASELGMRLDRPMAAVEAGHRADLFADAARLLASEGYEIVPLGDPRFPPVVARYLLQASAFVVCRSAELQQAACVAGTPSLRLDARDPFTAYPVRGNGVFTLATVVDLDTGRRLAIPELLTEEYFRNTRNYGYRAARASETAAAVAEMIEGVRDGWRDSPAQGRFRRAVADAGTTIGPRVRHVIEWDGAGGFVGAGRLARVQAERVP